MNRRSPGLASHLAPAFDQSGLIKECGSAAKRVKFREGEVIFSRGDGGDAVFYLEDGAVHLSYRSKSGKSGVIALLEPGEIFGAECIVGQPQRRLTAAAMTMCSVMRIGKNAVVKALYKDARLADKFISCLADQDRQYTDDLPDRVSNSSEKHFMGTLLSLSDLARKAAARAEAILSDTAGVRR